METSMDCTGTSDYTLSGPADMANNSTLGQKRSEDSGNGWEGPHDDEECLGPSSDTTM